MKYIFVRNGDVYIGYEEEGEVTKKHMENETDINTVEKYLRRVRGIPEKLS